MTEIAEIYNVSKSTVSRTILRGRERLLSGIQKNSFRKLLGESGKDK